MWQWSRWPQEWAPGCSAPAADRGGTAGQRLLAACFWRLLWRQTGWWTIESWAEVLPRWRFEAQRRLYHWTFSSGLPPPVTEGKGSLWLCVCVFIIQVYQLKLYTAIINTAISCCKWVPNDWIPLAYNLKTCVSNQVKSHLISTYCINRQLAYLCSEL